MINIYKQKKISDNLIMITESPGTDDKGVNMYVVLGEDKTLLFDSGFGVVDTLRKEIEKLSHKPIVCVLGHGHPDHAGAAGLFDTVYMNERDEVLLPISLSYERRMEDVFGHGTADEALFEYARTHIVDPGGKGFTYKNIEAGDTLSIGNADFEVFAVPGHTQGSIILLNRTANYALISDAAGPRTALVNLPDGKRVGLTAYRNGLSKFLSAINEDTVLWSGHSNEPMPQAILKDMEKACTQVLNGEIANDRLSCSHFARRQAASGKKMTEHDCGCVTLVYDANLL